MRIWTLHPKYLDRQGLLALWREGLLAQAVLSGKTRGYRHHPQLERFRKQQDPVAAMATYLAAVHSEAVRRGYVFNARKINKRRIPHHMVETSGQLLYEWRHLQTKLTKRDSAVLAECAKVKTPYPHPLFRIVAGRVQDWEKRRTEHHFTALPIRSAMTVAVKPKRSARASKGPCGMNWSGQPNRRHAPR